MKRLKTPTLMLALLAAAPLHAIEGVFPQLPPVDAVLSAQDWGYPPKFRPKPVDDPFVTMVGEALPETAYMLLDRQPASYWSSLTGPQAFALIEHACTQGNRATDLYYDARAGRQYLQKLVAPTMRNLRLIIGRIPQSRWDSFTFRDFAAISGAMGTVVNGTRGYQKERVDEIQLEVWGKASQTLWATVALDEVKASLARNLSVHSRLNTETVAVIPGGFWKRLSMPQLMEFIVPLETKPKDAAIQGWYRANK